MSQQITEDFPCTNKHITASVNNVVGSKSNYLSIVLTAKKAESATTIINSLHTERRALALCMMSAR